MKLQRPSQDLKLLSVHLLLQEVFEYKFLKDHPDVSLIGTAMQRFSDDGFGAIHAEADMFVYNGLVKDMKEDKVSESIYEPIGQ